MKNLFIAVAMAASISAGNSAVAQEATPDNTLTENVALTSDYRFRGISQTRLQPALQGGADYTNNPTGLYLGTWLSTIKWTKDAGGSGDLEWDIYGGKRGEIVKGLSYDVGALEYYYPSNGLHPNANTTELYGQLGYGVAYAKYSQALTNLFGFVDSKNSGYLDIGANIDAPLGTVLNLHAGRQKVRNNSSASYTDWKVGLTKDFKIVTGSLAFIGTNTDTYVGPGVGGKNLGRNSLVLTVTKNF